ncbi:MAG: hypothetical protein EOO08_03855 [Chitinophagaceae bacterium]|nr:MAG: hypothetical protein EOO08_03855 [Chitinophagaceae bacterium]
MNNDPQKPAAAQVRDGSDVHDSPQDEARLQPEETIIELPDVEDIPGQEFVHAPPLGELGDTTIASDDEEGKGLFDD